MSIKALPSYSLPSAAEIPLNKVSWPFETSKSVLLIHDMQEYFVDFYGDNNPLIEEVISNIVRLKQFCAAHDIPVVYTAQPKDQADEDRALLNDMWGKGLPLHPHKQPIIDALKPATADLVLTKWRYSAFFRSPLANLMQEQGRDQLLICGIYGHIGVMQTAVDGFMQDIKPFLIADAIADFSREDHLMALNYVARNAGRVITLDEVVSAAQVTDEHLTKGEGEDESTQAPFTKQGLREQLLPLIEDADDLEDDDNLIDFGLDSVSVMKLVDNWREQGLDVNFVALAKNPSINNFWQLLSVAGTNS